jgi:ribonuclease-3
MTEKSTSILESEIFHRFSDETLLRKSLTHRSNIIASAKGLGNNQRLEFLGDRVLGLIIAHALLELYPQDEEGALARRFATLVSRPVLCDIAAHIKLGDYLELPDGSDLTGLRQLDSTLEDACEALIGALYLDGGLEAARRFVMHYWRPLLENVPDAPKDAKTALQEWAQAQGYPLPAYTLISRDGPAHAPVFAIEVRVGEAWQAEATGTSKKAAEQLAAATLMEQIRARKT